MTKAAFIPMPLLRNLFSVVCLVTAGALHAQEKFSKQQVLEDLELLKTSLEETHYNLYAYTPKPEFDRNFNTVKTSIAKDSLSLLEATTYFQQVVSKVNNGHTEIDFPGQSYMDYARSGGTVFPLELAFEAGKALVRKNWSAEGRIGTGSEVLRIDGRPVSEILQRIYPQVSAERPYFKNAKIELFSFPRYYWQVFGRQQYFEVEIRSGETVHAYRLKAIRAMEDYEMRRTEVITAQRQLKFLGSTAYLNPGGFGGDKEPYRRFIDSAFSEIRARQSKNLIVDLRNHPGGADSYSDYLVSHFADKPFAWTSDFSLKTSALLKEDTRMHRDTTEAYWQQVLSHEDGEVYPYPFEEYQPQPEAKRFSGSVYVLVNRQSHSQAAVTAAQIQDYGFGTIVGEETGDYPSLYASVFRFELPNTNISVQVSKGRIVRVSGNTEQQGVIPDIRIKDHLLDESDEILEGLLMRLGTDR